MRIVKKEKENRYFTEKEYKERARKRKEAKKSRKKNRK